MNQTIARRIDRLEERLVPAGKGRPLYFRLSDWGGPLAFEEGTSDETIASFERTAFDRLVASGKITEADRDRVVFIVNTLVSPSYREDSWLEVQRGH
jgi:hypothetical protein